MVKSLFIGKAKSTQVEFLRFLPVGAVTTIIDFGLLIFLTEALDVHYLVSAAIAFLAGQIWSYVMSVTWIFARVRVPGYVYGFTAFLTISLVGLAITEVFLWYFTEELGFYYLLSKIVASAVSFLVLFFVRKRLLFS